MQGKLLIVEDEVLIAMDLREEVESFGYEVVGLAESADEALALVEDCRPDLVLMDLNIEGEMDGIKTAALLRDAFQVPTVFATGYSDDETLNRAAGEMPYGYLIKPFQSNALKATLGMAMTKAGRDASLREAHRRMTQTVEGMQEAVIAVSAGGDVQFMNTSAERLIACARERAVGRPLAEALDLRDARNRRLAILESSASDRLVLEFGAALKRATGGPILVDVTVSPTRGNDGIRRGSVVTLRPAGVGIEPAFASAADGLDIFETADLGMLQLDNSGRIVRVNDALLREADVPAEKLVGRTLSDLGKDPDPRIAGTLMQKLLQFDTALATTIDRRISISKSQSLAG